MVSDKESLSSLLDAPTHSRTTRSTSTTDFGTTLSLDLPCGAVEDFKRRKSLCIVMYHIV